jgi:hypothetical protein
MTSRSGWGGMHMARGGRTGGGGGMHVHPAHPPWVRPFMEILVETLLAQFFHFFLFLHFYLNHLQKINKS